MRIKNLILNENDIDSFGLKKFSSSKFGNIIALVGKNGSGKTRYLKAIENKLKQIDLIDFIANENFEFIPNSLNSLKKTYKNRIKTFESYKLLLHLQEESKKAPQTLRINEKIKNAKNDFNFHNRTHPINTGQYVSLNLDVQKEISKRIKVIKSSDFRALKASFDVNDKSKVSFQNIVDSSSENIDVNELSMINESALTFLHRLPHKLAFDDIDTRGDEKKFKNRVAYRRFKLLSELIYEFLGKELEWKSKTSNVSEHDDYISVKTTGYWILDGRELNYGDFSDGEKVLFTYALLLFLLGTNPRIKFKESIIIIDEPELNLHPKAQIKLIESLQGIIKEEGQLIIATHSLPIIANLEYGSIFLVRGSQLFSPSSIIPFESIDDLMGFNEHYNKIVEFLASTPSWAMTHFMSQCFDNPEVLEKAENNDPQLEIFKNLIKGDKLNLLDFGSGKGRLLDRIRESDGIWKRIKNYDCFDINEKNNELILSKEGSSIMNNLNELENDKYDLIIMVNVLHEIPIMDWTKSLIKIKKSLNLNGFFAIVEDTELPIGELPNKHGFLILNKDEMKIILGDKVSFITSNIQKYKDRIICGIIQKNEMNNINKNKLIATLEKLKANSLKSIIKYRESSKNELKIGRLYGLKANLYLNSDLAINELKGTQ